MKKRHKTLLDKELIIKNPDYGKKVVVYDIETSYIVSATWGMYNINVAKIIREPYIIGIGWKFLGAKETHYKDITDFPLYKKDRHSDKALLEYFRDKVIDQGEIFIAHNGNAFDWKWINGRFAMNGIEPPEPKRHIDTLSACRQKFKFPTNSLKDLLIRFNLGHKIQNDGIDLWIDCVEYNIKSRWQEMKRYCIGDVVGLEKLYLHIRPFITNHPNMNLHLGGVFNCPKCGAGSLQKAGFKYNQTTVYQTYRCLNCGARPSGEKMGIATPVMK